MREFLVELKRRHVYRFGLIYLAVAWLLVQVTVTVQEPFTSAFFPDSTKEVFDAFNELQRRSISPAF